MKRNLTRDAHRDISLWLVIIVGMGLLSYCTSQHEMIIRDRFDKRVPLRVAVLDFKDHPRVAGSGAKIADVVARYAMEIDDFHVIDRRIVSKVLEGKAIDLATDSGRERAKELFGADLFISGAVTRFDLDENFFDIRFLVSFNYLILDAKSARVLGGGDIFTGFHDEKRKFTEAGVRAADDLGELIMGIIIGAIADTVTYLVFDADTFKDEQEFLNEVGEAWAHDVKGELWK